MFAKSSTLVLLVLLLAACFMATSSASKEFTSVLRAHAIKRKLKRNRFHIRKFSKKLRTAKASKSSRKIRKFSRMLAKLKKQRKSLRRSAKTLVVRKAPKKSTARSFLKRRRSAHRRLMGRKNKRTALKFKVRKSKKRAARKLVKKSKKQAKRKARKASAKVLAADTQLFFRNDVNPAAAGSGHEEEKEKEHESAKTLAADTCKNEKLDVIVKQYKQAMEILTKLQANPKSDENDLQIAGLQKKIDQLKEDGWVEMFTWYR